MKYSLILSVLCCITFANAQETSRQSDLTAFVRDKVKKTDFPKGVQLSLGIINQDQSFFIGLEKAMRWKEVENENHIFEIGSISKVFSAMLLSIAVSDGVISLDDTIQYDWGIDWKVEQPITYKMLANHTSGLPRIPSNIKMHTYRILQESIMNIQKHAQANFVFIKFTLNEAADQIEFIISDDGVGFKDKKKPGIGLKNIKSRVEDIHGKISIDSKPGSGTKISIFIPIK